ncbi:MAG: endopeptidase La [Oscillospiraceae bacterium]|nr:endopeptidase La [Oscillospiraceae bacterium]
MIVVPTYNMILSPDAAIFFPLDQLRRNAGTGGVAVGEKVILIVAKENKGYSELTENDFYPIGVSGSITELNQQGYAVIRTQYRVNLEDVRIYPDHTMKLMTSRRAEDDDLDSAAGQEKLRALLREMHSFAEGLPWAQTAEFFINQVDSLGMAACIMSPLLSNSNEERYAILAEDSRARRAELIEKMLYEYIEVARITNEANSSQQQEYQQRYKEAAIKRQMEHLQKELDDMHPENVTDVQKFQQRIQDSGMNETARREAEKVLNRLRQEGKESVESGMLYDYLDFVTTLSWKKEKTERIDLAEARRILDEDHYGLKKVKDRIIQQIAVMNLKQRQSGSILLFVGAPGTGKTSIGKSIARALGRRYVRVSLGGVHDESDIRGHRRTYIGSMPGRIMDGIHKSGVSNPVMVLDEVDKLSASYNGSPASALLEVLDPEQNNTFTDHYMNVPYDLSDVLFICTANSLDTIPQPLLDRMEVIQFQGYTPLEKQRIAREHLIPKSMEAMGIAGNQMTVTDEALETLISDYTMEAGVRGLRKRIDALCRSLAVKVASDPDAVIEVTPEIVREELDTRPIRHDSILPEPQEGVVTGLAWTPVGGDILYIETMLMPGKGELIITGQLGDVMKESARIALSLVKSLFPREAEVLNDHDLHIHVPEGAVPKDGPSAGVTLTTALSSLLTGRVVDPHIAMTGEVALRGAVTPIGGLPEKLMAAQRAGITKVFIPKENLYDLKDVAQEVRDKIEIVPVAHVCELLEAVGVLKPMPIAV